MATFSSGLRRGLPRVAGGDAWPPADAAPVVDAASAEAAPALDAAATESASGATSLPGRQETVAPVQESGAAVDAAAPAPPVTEPAVPAASPAVELRRGLPRTPGGEPWPVGSVVAAAAGAPASTQPRRPAGEAGPAAQTRQTMDAEATHPQYAAAESAGADLRRGLPRVAGGDPWPPEGTAVAAASAPSAPTTAPSAATTAPSATTSAASAPTTAPAVAVAKSPTPAPAEGPRAPLPFTRTVWPGRAATRRPAPAPEPKRYGPFTKGQWAGAVIVGGLGLLILAGMAVAFVRFFLSLDFMQDFLATYPGEYHLPEGAPVGIPAWLGWQHFFNVFLMVLIIRSGLTIRNEKRPAVFWTPKNNPKGKTSLTIWFHQGLDLFWILNGVVFVVLLFVTGQWMRIVPTSWDVFPNALSAALQYVSLDWPTENGWVNYNALQQLAYFSTVFLAAPLAIVTGFRMSGLWPKKAERLSRAYPIEWARKVHFPTMLYFVVFIIIHVALVLATGALRNLNHMYAAQGSTDPTAYADNWTGFWMFVLSLVVIAAAWVAARPMTIAPIARLFGTVSGR